MRLKIKFRRNRKSFFVACLYVLISLGFVRILINDTNVVPTDTSSYVSAVKMSKKTSEPNEKQSLISLLDEIRDYQNTSFAERPRPPNTPGAFLHVGKAGGSTLCKAHARPAHSFRKPWLLDARTINGERIVNYFGTLTTYIHTPDFGKLKVSKEQNSRIRYFPDYSFYVANLRDPLSKLLSAFTYLHPKNGFAGIHSRDVKKSCREYFKCFPTLESFATQIGDDPLIFDYPFGVRENPFGQNGISGTNCTDLARASMANKVEFCVVHLYWNTKSILEIIPGWHQDGLSAGTNDSSKVKRQKTFLAIRSEHMNEDFFHVNKVLGDPHPVLLNELTSKKGRVQSANATVTKDISDLGRSRLCKALLPEYKTYFLAVSRAINLTPQDRQQSLELSRKNCPTLDWLRNHDDFTV